MSIVLATNCLQIEMAVHFVGSRSLFGSDLEFSEPPWFDETKQRYMHPSSIRDRLTTAASAGSCAFECSSSTSATSSR